jgi:hypothetical protein
LFDIKHELDIELHQAETELNRLRAEVARLKPLAEMGEAVGLAFKSYMFMATSIEPMFCDVEQLLYWYREQKGGGNV